MIELKSYQEKAAAQIARRFLEYMDDPLTSGRSKSKTVVPFFQALSAITAAGKTAILAQSVGTLAAALQSPPVFLWLSKASVVVEQSLANLQAGGRYAHLIPGVDVMKLGDYDAVHGSESPAALMYFATVGKFAQRDKEGSGLLIHKTGIDNADQSIWDALKERRDQEGHRRPLIVVYDEGHNLSDLQTQLLIELEPAGFLLASATLQLPENMKKYVDRLEAEGWGEGQLVTTVPAKKVVDSGLIKSNILMAGYRAPMEKTIDSLLSDMAATEEDAKAHHIPAPRAIYVCETNTVADNRNERDDPKRPFQHRQAPPILIWRYLVETHGIDPSEIAVYCSLDVHKDHPLPPDFVLFRGGDKDYAAFTNGGYRHVIFNLALQEGWDDPNCYFAYIDKSMDSAVQIQQVIGRVLRQPGAQHYASARLNTAQFYVRVDKNETFDTLLSEVGNRLTTDTEGGIRIVARKADAKAKNYLAPKAHYEIPVTAVAAKPAKEPIQGILDTLGDFRNDSGANVTAEGGRRLVRYSVGEDEASEEEWTQFAHAASVSARWVFIREVKKSLPMALNAVMLDHERLDAKVGWGSTSFKQVLKAASEVVDAFVDHVSIKQKSRDPFIVGEALVQPDDAVTFRNGVHEAYSDLNTLEREFAHALDRTGNPWFRNPPRSGYGIPLPSRGATSQFYPDFIVWMKDQIIAVDTTGGHILGDKLARKLQTVEPAKDGPALHVRFLSKGKRNEAGDELSSDGYTVWGVKPTLSRSAKHFESLDDAVKAVLV